MHQKLCTPRELTIQKSFAAAIPPFPDGGMKSALSASVLLDIVLTAVCVLLTLSLVNARWKVHYQATDSISVLSDVPFVVCACLHVFKVP